VRRAILLARIVRCVAAGTRTNGSILSKSPRTRQEALCCIDEHASHDRALPAVATKKTGRQVVEGPSRKAHFPPVHARNHRCRRTRRAVPNGYTTMRRRGLFSLTATRGTAFMNRRQRWHRPDRLQAGEHSAQQGLKESAK
jgi:hypothetical protein